jgi:[ribosomal protein S18]-alanine N-acetyltransferase
VVVVRSAGPPDPLRGILAYCALRAVADETEILGLAVAPGWRRKGFGRFLLRRALSLGRALGAVTAFLEVREGNASAIGLYRSLGFYETGRRRSYYRDPEEDALVLSRSLAGNTVSSGPRDS